MKKLKAISVQTIALVLMFGLVSFINGDNEKVATSELNSNWTLVKTVDGVEFYAMITECHDVQNGLHHQVAYFKLKNTNANDVDVTFNRKTWVGSQLAQNGDSKETASVFSVSASSEVFGDCDNPNKLKLFVKDLTHDHVPVTTHFAFSGITVSKK